MVPFQHGHWIGLRCLRENMGKMDRNPWSVVNHDFRLRFLHQSHWMKKHHSITEPRGLLDTTDAPHETVLNHMFQTSFIFSFVYSFKLLQGSQLFESFPSHFSKQKNLGVFSKTCYTMLHPSEISDFSTPWPNQPRHHTMRFILVPDSILSAPWRRLPKWSTARPTWARRLVSLVSTGHGWLMNIT